MNAPESDPCVLFHFGSPATQNQCLLFHYNRYELKTPYNTFYFVFYIKYL